jgi:hypothetical protein
VGQPLPYGRGLVYALLELADRVRLQPGTALSISTPILESPANPVRSVMRQFTSELLDKPWFYDARNVAALSHHARHAPRSRPECP